MKTKTMWMALIWGIAENRIIGPFADEETAMEKGKEEWEEDEAGDFTFYGIYPVELTVEEDWSKEIFGEG